MISANPASSLKNPIPKRSVIFIGNRRLYKGGNTPCVLNAANEIAVYAFTQPYWFFRYD